MPQNCEESSVDSEAVTYFLYLHTSLGKAIIGEFNLFRVDNLVEFNDYRPQNCWERISKMIPGPDNISFGKLGYTRAALKTLTQEALRVGIENMCSVIKKTNLPAIKMGCATGWTKPILDYTKDGIKSNGNSYLFCETVENMLRNCQHVLQVLTKHKMPPQLKSTLNRQQQKRKSNFETTASILFEQNLNIK